MKNVCILVLLFFLLSDPVHASQIDTVTPPESAQEIMPESSGDFGQDLWYVIKSAVCVIRPDLSEAVTVCIRLFGAVLLLSLLRSFQGMSKAAVELTSVVIISCLLLDSTHSLIALASQTVEEISQYGKLLLPVMTAALAAQGGTTSSAALYAGTAIFNTVLSTAIVSVLLPMVYIYLTMGILFVATGDSAVKQIQDFIKWLLSWCLKIILYLFTGYISITGVVSGATDQAALKAAKLTISGVVPVVGGILSDASEAVLVSIGVAKNAAGVYGILALIAMFIGPFLTISIQVFFLKISATVCGMLTDKKTSDLIDCFTNAMGFLLAMTGAVCLMQMISTICFMKGMG